METQYAIATTDDIKAINRFAIQSNLNRSLSDEGIKALDLYGTHVLGNIWILDDGDTLRGEWLCKMRHIEESVTVFIDMTPNSQGHQYVASLRKFTETELSHPEVTVPDTVHELLKESN
jgi:hypothetical protein